MCGRYTLTTELFRIRIHFGAEVAPDTAWKPRYNIAPTQLAPILVSESGKRRIHLARFGLIPFWAKDEKIASKLINARSESAWEKPSFRNAIKSQRCAVPADGFFEWKRLSKREKQPYRILPHQHGLFAFAGIWDRWKSPDGEAIESFSILTREANQDVRDLHDRMPVILPFGGEILDQWLSPEIQNWEKLKPILEGIPEGSLEAYPVSELVNSPKNETPKIIEEIQTTGDLFQHHHRFR